MIVALTTTSAIGARHLSIERLGSESFVSKGHEHSFLSNAEINNCGRPRGAAVKKTIVLVWFQCGARSCMVRTMIVSPGAFCIYSTVTVYLALCCGTALAFFTFVHKRSNYHTSSTYNAAKQVAVSALVGNHVPLSAVILAVRGRDILNHALMPQR